MKSPPFRYHRPETVEEALGLVATRDNARFLAGGQSLVPMLNLRLVFPDDLIDLNRVAGLSHVRETPDGLAIGALARQCVLERDPLIARHAPILQAALRHVGHVQTRSRGTIGGSLCHLDPSAEQLCVAELYGATLHVASARKRRDIAAADWPITFMTTSLEADEMLVGLTLPVWTEPHGFGFEEFARRHGDYALVAAAALVALDAKGRMARIAIALSGLDFAPIRLKDAERDLVGAEPDDKALDAACEHARAQEAMSDAQAPAEYRRKLAAALTRRALRQAIGRARQASP